MKFRRDILNSPVLLKNVSLREKIGYEIAERNFLCKSKNKDEKDNCKEKQRNKLRCGMQIFGQLKILVIKFSYNRVLFMYTTVKQRINVRCRGINILL